MKKFFFIVLLILFSNNVFANSNIVYIDINKILNESKAGKTAIKLLEDELDKDNQKFKNIEKEIKKEENGIIAQKNILSKEDYEKKISNLSNKINIYRKERSQIINNFNDKKKIITSNFINAINPIIADYASKNDISIVIRKEHMIIGKTELDISEQILILVNEKIKKIN